MPMPFADTSEAVAVADAITDAEQVETQLPSPGPPEIPIVVASAPGADSGARRNPDRASHAVNPGIAANVLRGGLSFLWAVGVIVGLARIVVGWRRLTGLSRQARPLETARHRQALDACARCSK